MNIRLNSTPFSYDYIKIFKEIVNDYDIIHVHSPNPLAEILSLFTNKKTIIHWHSDIVKQKITYLFYKPIQKRVLDKANKIIVTSPQYMNNSKQLADYKDKSVVIPLGLDPKRLEIKTEDIGDYEKIKNMINRKKFVLSIGRLVMHKDFDNLIEASKYLIDDIVVIIVGGGPLFKELSKKIQSNNLSKKIFLLGRLDISSVPIFLKNCKIFCLPSIFESFGLVLVEALYFGKPLVTTNVVGSGMNFVNINGETGLVVPPRNPKMLAEAINKILSDENLYQKFSENAFRRFKNFEIDSVTDKMIKLYNEVL
jgi:glycosyltransferase involved in cell wall biosynthesis